MRFGQTLHAKMIAGENLEQRNRERYALRATEVEPGLFFIRRLLVLVFVLS
jgi:hypothetical protein